MYPSNSLPGQPPANYKEVLYWKITERSGLLVIINLLSIPLAAFFGIGFFILAHTLGRAQNFALSDLAMLIFLIGILLVLVLHEFLHGIIMQSFGAKPSYGLFLKGLMFYAKAPGYAFTRNQYLVILLGPLAGLSILACLGIVLLSGTPTVWVLALWAIVNASSASADLWITGIVLKYPTSSFIVDERDGMRILLPPSDSHIEAGR